SSEAADRPLAALGAPRHRRAADPRRPDGILAGAGLLDGPARTHRALGRPGSRPPATTAARSLVGAPGTAAQGRKPPGQSRRSAPLIVELAWISAAAGPPSDNGGAGRIRTGVNGFAVRWMATLPPRRVVGAFSRNV